MPATFVRNGNGGIDVYLSALSSAYRLRGTSLADLSLSPLTAVLSPTHQAADPDERYAGPGGALYCGGRWSLFYHGENHALVEALGFDGYVATMNRAVSEDDGLSYVRDAPPTVISPGAAKAITYSGAYGAGGGTVFDFVGSEFIYMYYFDWTGGSSGIVQGLHAARACRSSCGEVGAWRKYHEGAFGAEAANATSGPPDAPSGPSTAVVPAQGGQFDAFVSVSYNSYLDAYLMIAATESGIALRASSDGVTWGSRFELLETIDAAATTMHVYYPALIDAVTLSRDATGRNLLLVYAVEMEDVGKWGSHRAYVAELELTRGSDAPSLSGEVELSRYYADGVGHYVTTSAPPAGQGYALEGVLGRLAANSLPGTHPLFECGLSSTFQMLSIHSDCEGQTSLRLAGYAWSAPGAGLVALHRCRSPNGDRFAGANGNCGASEDEGLLGYVAQ